MLSEGLDTQSVHGTKIFSMAVGSLSTGTEATPKNFDQILTLVDLMVEGRDEGILNTEGTPHSVCSI